MFHQYYFNLPILRRMRYSPKSLNLKNDGNLQSSSCPKCVVTVVLQSFTAHTPSSILPVITTSLSPPPTLLSSTAASTEGWSKRETPRHPDSPHSNTHTQQHVTPGACVFIKQCSFSKEGKGEERVRHVSINMREHVRSNQGPHA